MTDLASHLTAKQLRTIQRGIDLILSTKGITTPKNIEEFTLLGSFPPNLRYKDKEIYLSKEGQNSLRKIATIVSQSKRYSALLNFNDVCQSVREELSGWLSNGLAPNSQEFILPLHERLEACITNYTYLCKVEGIKLKGVDELKIGKKVIKPFNNGLCSHVKFFHQKLVMDFIEKEHEGSIVIIGDEQGSGSVSLDRFNFHCEAYLSLLRLYACTIYKTALWDVRISLINDCSITSGSGNATAVGWGNPDSEGTITRYGGVTQSLELDGKLVEYLKVVCFLDIAASLIEKPDRNDLEDAIVKAINWFGEAQRDRFDASKWIKLWTCLECFFTIESDEITEANARGIASIILFGGYSTHEWGGYLSLKSKIKTFYSHRCKVAHHAEYAHIEKENLTELAYIVSWVIVTIVSLLPKGFSTRAQIKNEVDRLDNLIETSPDRSTE